MPKRANAIAKFTETVDFPTPPLPDAIEINSTLFNGDNKSCASDAVVVPRNEANTSAGNSSKRMPTVPTPAPFNASTTFICSCICSAVLILAIASFTLTWFFSSLIETSLMPFVSSNVLCKKGSCNCPSSSRICCSFIKLDTPLMYISSYSIAYQI